MFTTQATTSNSLTKAIDIDDALIAMFNGTSLKWKAAKKIRKSGKITTLSCFGESLWNTMKEVKAIISDSIESSIRCSAISFLQQLKIFNGKPNKLKRMPHCFEEIFNFLASDKAVEKIESPDPTVSQMASTEVRDKFYEALRLQCVKFKMTPIILYGRLFEEEKFQYVAFIFGKRVFIIEVATDILDVQERACETMCTLIREFGGGGVPKVSSFIKVLRNIAHVVAEIDIQNETFSLCQPVADDIEILNLNELMDLIIASHYLTNQPCTRIEDTCAQTLFYKQPFLEGFYVNKCVFGCVGPSDKNDISPSQYPIVLVFCDTITQSNFLWNNKPLTVNVKKLMSNVNCLASKMPSHRIELLPTSVASDSNGCGGVRYGDQILYDGPLDVIFD